MASSVSQLGLKVIREALESLVDEGLASVVLLEALGRLPDDQELPADAAALHEFVEGPVSSVLRRHIGAEKTEDVLKVLRRALGSALRSVADVRRFQRPGRRRASQVDTNAVPAAGGPLRLLVLGGTERLLARICAAMGHGRVAGVACCNLDELVTYGKQLDPTVVIMDGEDPPPVAPAEVVVELVGLGDRMIVLWAADQPWGSALSALLGRRGVACAAVPRTAGVESLLDYVRARIG